MSRSTTATVSIVIPVFNEHNTIRSVIDAVLAAPLPEGIGRQIIVVDDFSTDGTRSVLEELAKAPDAVIDVIYHPKNAGKGAALRTGFQHATGDIVLIQDADLEYDPGEYGKLLAPILSNRADVVYGSRFMGGEPHRVLYFWHMCANRFLTSCSNMFCDLNLTDMETCYKVFRSEVIRRIDIEENRFGFEPEVTAKIGELVRLEGLRVYEVGISYYGRTYQEGKKIGWKDAVRALWCIFKYNNSAFASLVKYGVSGTLTALGQFAAMVFLVDTLTMRSVSLQNAANLISIELSFFIACFLHAWTLRLPQSNKPATFARRLGILHLYSIPSIAARIAAFWYLSKEGLNFESNTLIGIAVAIVINLFSYRRLLFRGR